MGRRAGCWCWPEPTQPDSASTTRPRYRCTPHYPTAATRDTMGAARLRAWGGNEGYREVEIGGLGGRVRARVSRQGALP